MSVTVEIRQKSIFRKPLTLEDVIRLSGLSYGTADENFRLIERETGNCTLLYDPEKLARGMELSVNENAISLKLSLPTSKAEIRRFYEVVKLLCTTLKTKQFILEGQTQTLRDIDTLMQNDANASMGALDDLNQEISKNEYKHFQVFGICFPISLGKHEFDYIGNDLDRLGELLHYLQSQDVYYAAPKVYRVKERLVGIYFTEADLPTVLPTEPYIILDQIKGIEDWYLMLKNQRTVRYEDFMNAVSEKTYFDANHRIISLSQEKLDAILETWESPVD
ncbi:DUF4299 family protein [Sellimonas catena]|uniref:DUF4299 family protein n=1 Tax=Sellimonas catena TaxID=2994035 RepID=A0A9W6C8N8_9FIRM|nr:DUF4299 family protein [Sellimonas catena]GLG05444.1 hypothetical protein Selli1_26180 [Sellimonas catena]